MDLTIYIAIELQKELFFFLLTPQKQNKTKTIHTKMQKIESFFFFFLFNLT